MRRIIIAIISYLFLMLAMFVGTDQYIKSKDERLKKGLQNQIDEIFANREKLIAVLSSGHPVKYNEMSIPPIPKPTTEFDSIMFNIEAYKKGMSPKEEWKENYGDLYKMYHLHWKDSEASLNNLHPEGWVLYSYARFGLTLGRTKIFPYAIGFKRLDSPFLYNYAPSVQSAVEEAFEFYTNDEHSSYLDAIRNTHVEDLIALEHLENEYYNLVIDFDPQIHVSGDCIDGNEEKTVNDHSTCPIKKGYMQNGFYRIFIAETQPQTYSIVKKGHPDTEERNKLWMFGAIGLTIVMLVIVIPIGIIESKRTKMKEELLYDKLKRLCNPSIFMKDYDKEKVDKANDIYQRLMEIKPDDKDALMSLQAEAVESLGIVLIDDEKLKELIEKVNPQRFMNPYNAEKVKIANDLYSRLSKEGLSYEEYMKIEEESKLL